MRWLMMGLCVSAMAMSVFAGAKSDRIFVHLEPEKSSFWQTATNNAMNLPVCFPEGATFRGLLLLFIFSFFVFPQNLLIADLGTDDRCRLGIGIG